MVSAPELRPITGSDRGAPGLIINGTIQAGWNGGPEMTGWLRPSHI